LGSAGANGRWVGMFRRRGPCESTDTAFSCGREEEAAGGGIEVVPRLRDGSFSRTALRAVSSAAERACGEPVKESKKSSEARHRGTPTRRGDPAPACAKRWRGACAALKARERQGDSCMRSAELVRHASCGAAGDGGRGQRNEHAASRRSAWALGGTAALPLRSRHDKRGVSWRVQPPLSLPITAARGKSRRAWRRTWLQASSVT